MSTQAPAPTELANPNLGMENFVSSLVQAGNDMPPADIAEPKPPETPPTPAPAKEATPEPSKPDAAPKETPKPAAAPEEDKKWPRTAKDWEAYKKADKERLETLQKERDDIKAEAARVKAEIELLKKTGPSPELEALKKEKAELDEQLRMVSVERHPKFKQYFDNKLGTQIEMAKRIVGADKGDQIAALLKAPESSLRDQQIEELISVMTPVQQGRLAGVLNSISEINAERESEISRARENYESMLKQQQADQETRSKQFTKLVDDTISLATDPKEGNPAFQKREGDDAWNTQVDQRIETAKTLLFGTPKPDIIAKAALAAVAYPAVLSQLNAQIQENESLKSQIKELQSATPRVEPAKTETGATAAAVHVNAKPGSMDPMSALGGWMKGTIAQQGE